MIESYLKKLSAFTFSPKLLLVIMALPSLVFANPPATHNSETSPTQTSASNQSNLSADTLTDLLSAEFANNEKQYRYSLKKYLYQAEKTQDAAVAKRATRLAQYLRDVKNVTKAAKLWSKIAPDAAEPHQLLANLFIAQNLFSKALPHFNAAIKQGENKVLLTLSAQASYMNAKEASAYLKLLDAASIENTENSGYLITLGVLNNRIEKHQSALDYFTKALVSDPDSKVAMFQKASTLKSLKQFDEAINTLDPLLTADNNNPQYQALQVQLLFLAKRNLDALKAIEHAVDTNRNNYSLIQYLALSAFDFKEQQKSKELLENLLLLAPKNTTPYFYLGLIAEESENLAKALEYYLKVADPKSKQQAQVRAIDLHSKATDKEQVIELSKRFILEDSTKEADYTLLLSRWLNNHEHPLLALTTLEKAIEKHPENTELIYAHAMYIEASDFSQAENDFKKLLRIDPENSVYLNAYGYTLTLHTSRYEEALTLIGKALEISPKDPATIDSMGWVKYKMQQYDEAVKYLSQAYELFQDNEVAYHLIAALVSSGDLARANQIFETISTQAPQNEYVEQARKLLEKPS